MCCLKGATAVKIEFIHRRMNNCFQMARCVKIRWVFVEKTNKMEQITSQLLGLNRVQRVEKVATLKFPQTIFVSLSTLAKCSLK